jgi:hypothetical protein
MTQFNSLKFNNPGLFRPSVIRGILDSPAPTGMINFNDVADRNIGTTSSFRYDTPGSGIRSTQQVIVDYSKFENHTFFQSAKTNVNLAFYKAINEFPFDGTRKEIEQFLDSLTGFEKYVYDNFPKNKGYLFFSGSGDSSGTHIEVVDFAGSIFPTIAKNKTGNSVLNPNLDSFSWEFQLYVPLETNDVQVICQKHSGSDQGVSLFLSESASTIDSEILFTAVSSSVYLQASASIEKGRFNHIVATFNRRPGINRLDLFVDEELKSTSSNFSEFGEMDFNVSPFYIGSGSAVSLGGNFVTPITTFSGAMDEFRFFHDIRTIEDQKKFAKKGIYQTEDLVLYFKFNEPSGSFAAAGDTQTERIVLDYSGNSLHGLINETGFSTNLRVTSSVENPMTYENMSLCPILFPNFQQIIDLNDDLLTSASFYDVSNPNLITKLVPSHYFLEGQAEEALVREDGTIVDPITGETIPGTANIGQAQIIQTMLYIWAKFFDEQKIVLDNFGKVLNVTYDGENAAPDQVLPRIAEFFGVTLPNLFNGSSVEQFINAENLSFDYSTGEISLKDIQNQIWRRILVNLKDIIQSKGTLHSVKSFVRALGIDPDSNFRIREYGGPTRKNLSNQREIRSEVSAMLDMSGTNSLISSQILSASRTEIGFPNIDGTFVSHSSYFPHGISNNISDGYLTSGSFTYEAIYKYPKNRKIDGIQSLARIHIQTGSIQMFDDGETAVSLNMVAVSGSEPQVKLYARSGMNSSITDSPFLTMSVNADIFDGNHWNVSFGRFRADDPSDYLVENENLVKSYNSSSYFLRAARATRGNIAEQFVTQSFFQEANNKDDDSFCNNSSTRNASGSFIIIGSQSLNTGTGSLFGYLNSTDTITDTDSRETNFNGLVSQIRFWSKGLLEEEWREHVRNFKSLGVINPISNFNFETVATGSWNRLRIDASMDQVITSSSGGGNISIFDFSQNSYHLNGSGFEPISLVIKPETFFSSYISPKFDQASTSNKVRARSYQDYNIAKERNAKFGIVNQIALNEEPSDDVRFTIDFSIVDSLDQDIVNIFSTLEELDNILGSPELMFSPDYPGLEKMRKIYFNRLTEKIKLKSFFEFFKWFDRSIGDFISALLPRKTKFRGVNFIIESHMLERPKFENLNIDQYLNAATERSSQKGTILLQQIVGQVKKY